MMASECFLLQLIRFKLSCLSKSHPVLYERKCDEGDLTEVEHGAAEIRVANQKHDETLGCNPDIAQKHIPLSVAEARIMCC